MSRDPIQRHNWLQLVPKLQLGNLYPWRFASRDQKQSRQKCVPKPELGNEEKDVQGKEQNASKRGNVNDCLQKNVATPAAVPSKKPRRVTLRSGFAMTFLPLQKTSISTL